MAPRGATAHDSGIPHGRTPLTIEKTGSALLYSERFDPLTEASILFSAGFHDAAMGLLRPIASCTNAAGRDASDMLLAIYRALDRREPFEEMARELRRRFGEAGCGWDRDHAPAPGSIGLEGILASPDDLEPFAAQARGRGTVAVDFGRVLRIDFGFAPALCARLRIFKLQGRHVILGNITELHARLLEAFGADHHAVILRRKREPAELAPAAAAQRAHAQREAMASA
jgi:hypothetical protein